MPKCEICDKTVYPMDPQINLDGSIFHKTCAKCADCSCQITLSNFTRSGSTLLCKTHYFKRFSETGQYLGGEKFSQKAGGEGRSSTPPPPANARSTSPPPPVNSRAPPSANGMCLFSVFYIVFNMTL
jgi:cysteine/glycine-rich protein